VEQRAGGALGLACWTIGERFRRAAPLTCVLAACLAAQLSYWLRGIRVDASALGPNPTDSLWQLLDVGLLRHHLLQSLWYLHAQPPLFNLAVGLLLKLPAHLRYPVETSISELLGLALATGSYLLARELSVGRWLACAGTVVFIVASPGAELFQNWLGWSYPVAVMATFWALSAARYLRTSSWMWGLAFFVSGAGLVLVDSTYQWPWLVGVSAVMAYAMRRSLRRLVAVASVPLLAVAVWYGKDAALFGTFATSSWLGMNLAKMVLVTAPAGTLRHLQAERVLSPLASIGPFSREELYLPRFGSLTRTGIPALDELLKSDGAINFNNLLYVKVSSEYLHQDLAFIVHEPGLYAKDLSMAVEVWETPFDQYFPPTDNAARLGVYSRLYDRFVLAQPLVDPATPVYPLYRHEAPPLSRQSFVLMVVTALSLLGLPVVAIRWRRAGFRPWLAALFMWGTMVYSFVTTSTLEVGENERFFFELGALPFAAAFAVASEAFRAARAHRSSANYRALPSPSAESSCASLGPSVGT
jgi:hypothetical protein